MFVGANNAVLLARAQTPPAGAQPAANAAVSVGSVSGKTDSMGAFTLQNIPAGLDVLHVAAAGGPSADFPVTIFGGVTANLGNPKITRAAALAAVTNALSSIHTNPQVTVIIGPQEPLPSGTTVSPALGDDNGQPNPSLNYTARSEQWFIFVDPAVEMKYQHPVEFFFIDASTGALTKLDETSWPFINGLSYYRSPDTTLTSPDLMAGPKPAAKSAVSGSASRTLAVVIRDARFQTSMRALEGPGGSNGPRLLLASLLAERARSPSSRLYPGPAAPQTPAAAGPVGSTYGVIIEGADESDENADIQNITGMFGKGGIPPAANTQYAKPNPNTPAGTGTPRTDDVLAKFQQQCMAAGPDDTLFIYITAHGTKGGGAKLDTTATEKDGTTPKGFETLIAGSFDFSKCKACHIIIIIDACYSGRMASQFNDILKKTPCPPNYTIMSASDATHEAGSYGVWSVRSTGGAFTNGFLSAFNAQAGTSPGGSVDLPTAFNSAKQSLSGAWDSNVAAQNPQIFSRTGCPCHPPTNTPCTTGQGGSTANQIGTNGQPTGNAPGTTGSTNCQPTSPTNPTPTQTNNNPGGTTTPAPQTTPAIGGGTPQSGTNQPAPGGGTPQTPLNPQPQPGNNPGGVNLAPGAPGGAAVAPGSTTVATPPPAAAGPKEIGSTTNNGVTTTVYRNPDGTLTTVSKDAQGNTVANPASPIPPTVTTQPQSSAVGPTTATATNVTVGGGAAQPNPGGNSVAPGGQTGSTLSPANYPPELSNPTNGVGGNAPGANAGGGAATNSPAPPSTGLTPEEVKALGTVFLRSPCEPCDKEWVRWQLAQEEADADAHVGPVPPGANPVMEAYAQREKEDKETADRARAAYEECAREKCPDKLATAQPGTTNAIGGGAPVSNAVVMTPGGGAVSGASNPSTTGGSNATGIGPLTPSNLSLNGTNSAINGIVVVVIQYIAVSLPANPAPASSYPTQPTTRLAPHDRNSRVASTSRWTGGSIRLAAFHPRDSLLAFSPRGLPDLLDEEEPQAGAFGKVIYSLVANGNSSGQALELQVYDPSGQAQDAALPEGLVLEPLKQGSAKPVAELQPGANILRKPLVAYCVEYLKLPPEVNMLYRVAPQAVQDKFAGIQQVLQAGRQLAAAGKFHPDSDPATYEDSIRQYALWSKIENWDQQKFGEVFLDKTKQNAAAAKVKWTKQMEQSLLSLVPGRWRDIQMVLDEATRLSNRHQGPGSPQ